MPGNRDPDGGRGQKLRRCAPHCKRKEQASAPQKKETAGNAKCAADSAASAAVRSGVRARLQNVGGSGYAVACFLCIAQMQYR